MSKQKDRPRTMNRPSRVPVEPETTADGKQLLRCRYPGPCKERTCGRILLTVLPGADEQRMRGPLIRECPMQGSHLLEFYAPRSRRRRPDAA
jgi:hypothetical protein